MSKCKKARIILYVLLAFWMILIFVMSSQKASQSSQLSGGIVYKLITVFFSKFDSMPLDDQTQLVNTITFIVRKSAHFLEYFILGLLATLIMLTYDVKHKLKAIMSVVFCLLYATSDEIHQYFVEGRACRFTDICIDAAGSVVAIVITILIACAINKRRMGEIDAKKEID